MVFQKQFSVFLGVELFALTFAIDFAVSDVANYTIVQPMLDFHLYTQHNENGLSVKWH